MDIAQHPINNQLFALATSDHSLSVVDLNTNSLISTWQGHQNRINGIAFTDIKDDKDLVNVFFSVAEDGYIKIWDTTTSNMVSSICILQITYSY